MINFAKRADMKTKMIKKTFSEVKNLPQPKRNKPRKPMFLLTLLQLPDNTAEHYKQQRLDFLNNFSVQQIRLMLFVIMKLSEKEIFTEVTEFINFWTIRYLEIQEAE